MAINHEKRMLKYPTEFTLEQNSLIYGSLLGDACVHKPKNKNFARFQVKHSVKQSEYLKHKFEIMRPWINYPKPAISDDQSGYKNGKPRIVFYTTSHPLFNEIHNEFYKDGIKIVTSMILQKIDALALTYWFCDDGCFKKCGPYRKDGERCSVCAQLSTESFTVQENEMIRDWFQDKWNIKCSLQRKIDDVFRIHFSAGPARELIELIRPHVHPSMAYKLTTSNAIVL